MLVKSDHNIGALVSLVALCVSSTTFHHNSWINVTAFYCVCANRKLMLLSRKQRRCPLKKLTKCVEFCGALYVVSSNRTRVFLSSVR